MKLWTHNSRREGVDKQVLRTLPAKTWTHVSAAIQNVNS